MKHFMLIFTLLLASNLWAQKEPKKAEVVIMTSAECGTCKKTLEDKLNYVKGVRYAELDVDTKKLTVGYSPKKISVDKIKEIISHLGYDADDVPANPSSQEALPTCCKPGGMK